MSDFVPGIVHPPTARARQYVIAGQMLAVIGDGERPAIPIGAADERWVYLGACAGEPCFARTATDDDPAPDGCALVGLRRLYGVLAEVDFAIATHALGLTTWDAHHRFCGRCGTPTVRVTHERARTCPACELPHYPRLSPAVIALVERDGRALLARNARTGSAFHSCLAGFVEVGETLEEALARELREEAGIEIADARYAGSQPWPFTSSLMIGFTARWAGGELAPDPEEVVDVGWFGPDELPPLPPRLSIARALIDAFVIRHGGTPPP